MARQRNLIAAAAASLALVAAPALADAPFTVSYDGVASGDHAVTAISKGTITLAMNGTTFTCSTSSLGATVHANSISSGANVATITAATLSGCSMSGYPISFTVTSPTWSLNLNSTNSQTSGLGDTLNGSISNVSNFFADMNLGFYHCTFNISGSLSNVQFLEDNAKGGQEIDINASPGLTVSNTSAGCLGLVNNGDAATFDGQYNLSGQHINMS